MELIFIRHFATLGNERRAYIGRTDEHLSERAREDFHREKYAYPEAERVVCSPLLRCVETARLIFPEKEIVTEPLFRECDFGQFEGKTYDELKAEPDYQKWLDRGGMIPFPQGEDPYAFRRRCVEGMRRQIDSLICEGVPSCAFVVHGGTIMSILSGMSEEKGDFYRWQVKNGGVCTGLVSEEEWRLGRELIHEIKIVKGGYGK